MEKHPEIPNIHSLGGNKISIGGQVYYVSSLVITTDNSSKVSTVEMETVYLEQYVPEEKLINKVKKDKKSKGGFYKLMQTNKGGQR